MENRQPLIVGTTLILGLVVAALAIPGVSAPQARAQTPSTSRVREVLPRGVLDDAGEQLARISSLVQGSVVHIESKRDGRNGGTVEETGSGVIMRGTRSAQLFVVTNRHVIQGSTPKRISFTHTLVEPAYVGRAVRVVVPLTSIRDISEVMPVSAGDSASRPPEKARRNCTNGRR